MSFNPGPSMVHPSGKSVSPLLFYIEPNVLVSVPHTPNQIHEQHYTRNTFQSFCICFREAETGNSLETWGWVSLECWDEHQRPCLKQGEEEHWTLSSICTETVECALPHNMCIPHTHAGEGGGDIKNIHSDTWWSWPAESHSKISHAYNLNDHEQDIGEGPQRLYRRSRGLEIINAITQKAWDDSWVSAEVHQPPERWFHVTAWNGSEEW